MKKLKQIQGVNVLDSSKSSKKVMKIGTNQKELNYFYTEITKENINKWDALKKLAKHLNIKTEEIVAIGDNQNDLEMIQNAGLGVIMGESSLAKKNLNRVITKSSDENGVAEAINKYVL